MAKCNDCDHRQWEEGDRDYSPPGYGTYYCEIINRALTEKQAYKEVHPNCPLWVQLEFDFDV